MRDKLRQLATIARRLQCRPDLEEALQIVADGAIGLLDVQHASVRLLDAGGERLLAVTRAGQREQVRAHSEYKLGEGLVGWIAEHGKPICTSDADADPRFAVRDDVPDRVGSFLGVPLLAGASCMGVLSVSDPQRSFDEQDQDLAMLLATIAGPHVEIARLSRISRVDRLTGALNRHGLDDSFPREDEGAREPLSMVMVDIDHFKVVNDDFGHATGDVILSEIATRLASCVRSGDAVVRYGGEEFLLVLPHVDTATARVIAERARLVAQHPIVIDGQVHRITISLGVAERRGDETRDELIGRADGAMYAAKRAGRNRVELAE